MSLGMDFFRWKKRLSRVFQRKPHLESDLPVIHFSRINTASGLYDLKPGQVFDGFVSALEGSGDSILHGYF